MRYDHRKEWGLLTLLKSLHRTLEQQLVCVLRFVRLSNRLSIDKELIFDNRFRIFRGIKNKNTSIDIFAKRGEYLTKLQLSSAVNEVDDADFS